MIQLLDTGKNSAAANMAMDAKLLNELKNEPVLHLYDWAEKSATVGYFIDPAKYLRTDLIDVAKRPTGGGVTFHIWDLAFSFLMPSSHPKCSENTLENYQFVNGAVLEALKELFHLTPQMIAEDAVSRGLDCGNFCMARPTKYDVVYQGMKLAGAAQRRKKQGYLHQGTISLAAPDRAFLEAVLKVDVMDAMEEYTFAPVKDIGLLPEARIEVQKKLAVKLREALA